MSRIGKKPVELPAGVELQFEDNVVTVKKGSDSLQQALSRLVTVEQQDNVVTVKPVKNTQQAVAQSGTARALISNMVVGLTKGFEKRLNLVGVGYRAKLEGQSLNLTLGFSHPVNHPLPTGVSAELPSQTEIVLKSANKQLLGQVAAEIRGYRPPEPYKGKGVKYADETIVRKEAKKK